MSKIILLSLVFLLFSQQSLFAETSEHILTGRVIDIESNEPIKNVELFISGATVGTTTNENGEFTLKTPFLPCHLIVMHVSYKSVVLPITKSDNFSIKLSKINHGINEVSVKGKNMRKRNLRLFYKYFLWNTDKHQIQILNDSILKFKRDEHDFHAYSNTPLLVRNKQLGYNIKILIQDFHVCKKRVKTGEKLKLRSDGTGVFQLKAYHYYNDDNIYSPQKRKKIIRNRRKHYYGSIRHFLSSLYQGKLSKNGFHLETENTKNTYPFVLTKTGINTKRFKFTAKAVKINYYYYSNNEPINLASHFDPETTTADTSKIICYGNNFQINLNPGFDQYYTYSSVFISQGKEFEVRPNGTSPVLFFEVKGYMGSSSPANTLPDDYKP